MGKRVIYTATEKEMWETNGHGRVLLSLSRGSPLKSRPWRWLL
jgi:hypothetical protein